MTNYDKPKFVIDLPPQDGTTSRADIMEGRGPIRFVADTVANVGFVATEAAKLGFKGFGRGVLKVAGIAYATPSHVKMLAEKTGSGYLKFEYDIPAEDAANETTEQ